MKITRRDAIRGALGAGAATALTTAVSRTGLSSPAVHVPPEPLEKIVPSVCLLCPSGCGMLVRVVDGRAVKIEGNPLHPINGGALCPRGQAALEWLYHPDRVLQPLRRAGQRGEGKWQPIGWDEALGMIAERLGSLRATGQSHTVAILYGETRGQMRAMIHRFLEVYGSRNAISHDSLNIQAAKAAHYLTQGIKDLLAYDLENTRYLISFGASLMEAGRPLQRFVSGIATMRRGRPMRGKVVMVDPRQGVTGAKADEWIPIRPGTDAALALGMANVIVQSGLYDKAFVAEHCFGFEDFTDEKTGQHHMGFKSLVLRDYAPQRVEEITGVPAATVARLAGEFATNRPAVAVVPCRGGLHNGSNGLYTAMAIHSLNALVGSLDVPGGVLVQRYPACAPWPDVVLDGVTQEGLQRERLDGAGTRVHPVADHVYQNVASRLLKGQPYPINLLFLYNTNPVFELAGGQQFIEALQIVPFIIDVNSFITDSNVYADLILPEPTFLERYQDDFIEGVGYAGVGLRQPVVQPLGDTRSFGDVLLSLAQALGGSLAGAFPGSTMEELLAFRLGQIGVPWEDLKQTGVWSSPSYRFAAAGETPWNAVIGRDRTCAPADGRFDFFSRELYAILQRHGLAEGDLTNLGISARGDLVYLPHYEPPTYDGEAATYPFFLNTYRPLPLADGMGANLPSLQDIWGMVVGVKWDSWVEINVHTAQEMGIADGDWVWVESPHGRLRTRVRLVEGLRPEVVNIPYGQGHTAGGRWARGRGVNPYAIMGAGGEPLAGLAGFSRTRVRIYKVV